MNRRRRGALLLALLAMSAGVLQVQPLHAQRREITIDSASTIGVVLSAKAGLVLTSPRREFPSLRVGESATGTGIVSSRFGEMGMGNRVGFDALIPFSEKLGMTAGVDVQTAVIRLSADGTRPAIRMDVQTLQTAFGLEGNIHFDPTAFTHAGLRSVYIAGGMDIGMFVLANRVEAFRYDTAGVATPAIGSFDNNEPFRTLVAVRFAGGVRYGIGTHMELLGEASYGFAVNPFFSADVVNDNTFTIDNAGISVGIGYRF